jgi:predicted Zn-dependent protease
LRIGYIKPAAKRGKTQTGESTKTAKQKPQEKEISSKTAKNHKKQEPEPEDKVEALTRKERQARKKEALKKLRSKQEIE